MYYSLCLNAQGLLFMHRQKRADTEVQLRKRYCQDGTTTANAKWIGQTCLHKSLVSEN